MGIGLRTRQLVIWPGEEETQHRIAIYKYLRGSRSRDYIKKCFLQMKAFYQRTGLHGEAMSFPTLIMFLQ